MDKKQEIEYNLPCYWTFKVIGCNNDEFCNKINKFVDNKDSEGEITYKLAKNEKHISYTFNIYVENKDTLYKYYRILKDFDETKFCF